MQSCLSVLILMIDVHLILRQQESQGDFTASIGRPDERRGSRIVRLIYIKRAFVALLGQEMIQSTGLVALGRHMKGCYTVRGRDFDISFVCD